MALSGNLEQYQCVKLARARGEHVRMRMRLGEVSFNSHL
jgi:hypothetical protein